MTGIARCGHGHSFLVRGAIEGRPNVRFAIRQCGKRDLEGISGWQALELIQQKRDNALMLARPAFGNLILLNQLKFQGKWIPFCHIVPTECSSFLVRCTSM